MSYEELIDAIEKDAVKERQKIIADAGFEAKGIIEKAETDLKSLKEKKIAEFEGYLESEKALAVGQAKREADILLISAKSEGLTELFQKAEKKIVEIKNGGNYKDILSEFEIQAGEDMREGVILVSRDNRFRMVNTLKSRMERAKADILPVLNKILFD